MPSRSGGGPSPEGGESLEVTAWSNGGTTYGLRIGKPNRDRFFNRDWNGIVLEVDGETYRVSITPGFWKECPEIRDPVIREWLRQHRSLKWPKGQPPKAALIPLGGNRFRLEGQEQPVWEVEVKGDRDALRLFSEVMTTDEFDLREADGQFLLRMGDLDHLTDAGVVRSRARSLVKAMSGGARLILGWSAPMAIGNVWRRRPDGRRDVFLEAEPIAVKARVMPVTVRLGGTGGDEEVHYPADPALRWLRKGREEGSAERVLRLLSEPNLSWVELYRILEIILEDAGGNVDEWASDSTVERFKRTANSVGAVGDLARHGRERTEPPPKPMSIKEAQGLVLGIVRSWLDS